MPMWCHAQAGNVAIPGPCSAGCSCHGCQSPSKHCNSSLTSQPGVAKNKQHLEVFLAQDLQVFSFEFASQNILQVIVFFL